MMLGSLVSGSAPCFHDVRTYWSPEACERVTGQKPDGVAANGFIHLINSGATAWTVPVPVWMLRAIM